MDRAGFSLDEEPLRQWVLKAYHERRLESAMARAAMDAVRQFLSGPPGGTNTPESYWFEEDPPSSVKSYLEDLEKVAAGLSGLIFEPIFGFLKKRGSSVRAPFPKPAVYVASLAGSLAVRAGIDETVACAVISAALIGLSRIGAEVFEEALRGPIHGRPSPPVGY